MWPFPQSQKYLQLLFMYPTDSKWMKRGQIICSASILIGNFVTMIMSMVFFFKFILIDIESSIGSVYQISATINSTYGCAFLFLSRHKIKHMLQSLTRIYEASEWNKCPIFRYFIAKPIASKVFAQQFRCIWQLISLFDRSKQEEWTDLVYLLQIYLQLPFNQHYTLVCGIDPILLLDKWTL